MKLKKAKGEKPKRLNLEELNGPKAELYSLEVNNRFEALGLSGYGCPWPLKNFKDR